METGRRTVHARKLDDILTAHSLSPASLPPQDPSVLMHLITNVGPVTETLPSTAVYLSRILETQTGIKARLGRKTYEFPRLPLPDLYELPVLSNHEEGASIVFSQDPHSFSPGGVAMLAQTLPVLEVFLRNGLEYLRATLRPLYDKLTGLPDKNSFPSEFQYAIGSLEDAMLRGQSDGLGLIFIDIDKFKEYNDQLGHPEGDKALQRMGMYLRTVVRESDICHRYGGEEFVVGTVNSSKEKTVEVAERIRAYVERQSREDAVRGLIKRPFTITAGVAHTTDIDPGIASPSIDDALVYLADQRLYRAKHSQDGLTRNRVSWRYTPVVNTKQ